MTTRRRFLANLSLGAAALLLRFRPESGREVVAIGEYEYCYIITRAYTPKYPGFCLPILNRDLFQKPNYNGPLQWINLNDK